MLVDLANVSAAQGHEITVCVTGRVATLASDLAPTIKVVVLGRRRRATPVAFGRLAVLARSAEIVHAHMRSNAALIAMLRGAHLIRAPLIFHDHFGSIERDHSVPRWFRLLRRYITQYVGVYSRLGEWAIDAGVPADRVAVIPNALDLRRLHAATPRDLRVELGLPPATCVAVLIASLRRDKGVEVLLDAVSRSTQLERLHVAIAGGDGEPDYAAAMRRRASELGIDKRVTFLGPRADVPELLHGADVGLLASHSESGPLVLIEYLACGLPIVATRVGDIGRHLAGLGVTGFVSTNDPDAFARELDALVEMPSSARRARGLEYRELVDREWNLETVMPRWYAVYADAIRNQS